MASFDSGPAAALPRDFDDDGMRAAVRQFLDAAGIRELAADDAPERSAEAWRSALLRGYEDEPAAILAATTDEVSGELVAVCGIPFVSVCSHHLLPFFGSAHVAYLPGDRLLGLGRIEDLVGCLSRRLQLQEHLGSQIATALVEHVGARGAACILEAEHLCVFARGRRQRGTIARTSTFAGACGDDPDFRSQCLSLLGNPVAATDEETVE